MGGPSSIARPDPAAGRREALRALCARACEGLARTLGAGYVGALLLVPGEAPELAAEHAAPGAGPAPGPLALGGLRELLEGLRRPVLYGEPAQRPELAPLAPTMRRVGASATALLPLRVEDVTAGCLFAHAGPGRGFSAEEFEAGVRFAERAASDLGLVLLTESRQQLVAALEHIPERVVITDLEGRILYVNAAFERVTGYSRDEARGQTPRLVKSGRQDDDFYRALWARVTGGSAWHGRLVNKRKDGSLVVEDALIAPVRDEQGRVTHFLGVERDVTAQLEVEETLARAQRLECAGRLAAGLAQDFANKLTTIAGHVELALRDLPADSPGHADLEVARDVVRSAGLLSRKLLAYAQRRAAPPGSTDVNALVTGLANLVLGLLGPGVTLEQRLGEGLATTAADAGPIEQVLLALVLDARDALGGAGALVLSTGEAALEAAEAATLGIPAARYVAISVSGRGDPWPGCDAPRRAFEHFFSSAAPAGASAMGLATCQALVARCGGALRLGRGADGARTVAVLLPAGPKAKARAPVEALPRGDETVLIVDDERAVLVGLRHVLAGCGYRVLEASGGSQALEAFLRAADRVRLVVADLMMVDGGGASLAREILDRSPDVKILLISGFGAEEVREAGGELLSRPNVQFMQKPFEAGRMAAKVREMLDGEVGEGGGR